MIFNNVNCEILLNFPNTLDSGLAKFSNNCRRYPIDISLDIGIWLYSDVNVLSNKNDFNEKKELGPVVQN